jgi:hypothetical protein
MIDADQAALAFGGRVVAAGDDSAAGLAERLAAREALARSLPPSRRERRPSLESQLRQVWRAAKAESVAIAVTVEGRTMTVQPVRLAAASIAEPSDAVSPAAPAPDRRSLFQTRVQPKKRVIL